MELGVSTSGLLQTCVGTFQSLPIAQGLQLCESSPVVTNLCLAVFVRNFASEFLWFHLRDAVCIDRSLTAKVKPPGVYLFIEE